MTNFYDAYVQKTAFYTFFYKKKYKNVSLKTSNPYENVKKISSLNVCAAIFKNTDFSQSSFRKLSKF